MNNYLSVVFQEHSHQEKLRNASPSDMANLNACANYLELVPQLPARQESQRHNKSRHIVRPISFDDTSSQQSEASNTAFPEIQQLPRSAKLMIWRFLHERIEALTNRDEEVPAKMSLVERACDIESDDDSDDDFDPSISNGPYGTVLHTACAIGNKWIVEMQIKARVDVTALDDHGWTALMVAEAQGHTSCSKVIVDYMEESAITKYLPSPWPPSELVKPDPSDPIYVDEEYLTAISNQWRYGMIQKRVHVRANHPIPKTRAFFYFEMSIISNGPLGYVRHIKR